MPPLGMHSWLDYDEALKERGCVMLDLSLLTSSNEELDAMNQNKRGWWNAKVVGILIRTVISRPRYF